MPGRLGYAPRSPASSRTTNGVQPSGRLVTSRSLKTGLMLCPLVWMRTSGVVDEAVVQRPAPGLGAHSGLDVGLHAVAEQIPQVGGWDAGARVGDRMDDDLVVAQVIGEGVVDDRLVEDVVQCLLQGRGLHSRWCR